MTPALIAEIREKRYARARGRSHVALANLSLQVKIGRAHV